jgi:hypothetical protein
MARTSYEIAGVMFGAEENISRFFHGCHTRWLKALKKVKERIKDTHYSIKNTFITTNLRNHTWEINDYLCSLYRPIKSLRMRISSLLKVQLYFLLRYDALVSNVLENSKVKSVLNPIDFDNVAYDYVEGFLWPS